MFKASVVGVKQNSLPWIDDNDGFHLDWKAAPNTFLFAMANQRMRFYLQIV